MYRYTFLNVEFDEAKGSLAVDGVAVAIEPRPRRLLAELLRHANEVVTKEELIQQVWDGRITVENVIANAVTKLRKALGPAAAALVVTLPRVGYRFAGTAERMAVGRSDPVTLALHAGQTVPGRDGYVLERALGDAEGSGHSPTWLARHGKLGQRRVFKFAVDADGLRELKREFTLIRLLKAELGERPGFVPLVDSNLLQSPFFLEYEYVGPDLLTWAPKNGQLAGLSTAERLNLFLDMADAIAAAHSVAVLHKDIKPANVLMAGDAGHWIPVITDFGSGHATDPARLTALGLTAVGLTISDARGSDAIAGTPLYLAPELLARKAATVQSDLFALGLMLFQLMVGDLRRPMSTGWQRDIDDDLLREDIAAATEGDPARRLASVHVLTERLRGLEQRHAQRLRLQADALALADTQARLQRSRERRPWLIALVASLAVGLSGSLWFQASAKRALALAKSEASRAQAINEFMTKDVLQSADINRAGSIKAISMQDVLARASARASQRFKEQPRTEAAIHQQLGQIYLRTSTQSVAIREYQVAVRLLEPLVSGQDAGLLTSRFGLAQAMASQYQVEEGAQVLAAAERDAGLALQGPASELTIMAKRAQVEVLMARQQDKQALISAKQLVQLTDTWADADLADRFDARQSVAELHMRLDQTAEAQAVLDQIMRPPYSAQDVGEVTFARAQLHQGKLLRAAGKTDAAKAILQRVQSTLTSALGPRSLHVGLVNYELADLYSDEGDFQRATASLQAALTAFETSLGANHGNTVSVATNLAIVDVMSGRTAEGLNALDKHRHWFVAKGHGPEGVDFYRAWALNDLGRPAQALSILDSINLERLAWLNWGPNDWRWKVQAERGRALSALGNRSEGMVLIQTASGEMSQAGSLPWVQARYRKLAGK